ncbi:MAG: DAK2 domain-containing protein [Clostridium sp.]
MEQFKINGQQFYNMVVNASYRLAEQMEYVNAMNVFPVPDGDTGTNMSMTFTTAVSEIAGMESRSISDISKTLAKGALMGARGNSGVILSQIFRGIAKGLEGRTEVTADVFANSINEGSIFAYKAVMRPTEGTILTIIKSAGTSALAVSLEEKNIVELLKSVCRASEDMLNKTPDMLPQLKKAKVVDAGGMGLLILLKGMLEALETGVVNEAKKLNIATESVTHNYVMNNGEEIENGYCTEFFINALNIDVEKFKDEISELGDSMVVVGLEDIVKVHIHSNNPGKILSLAGALGELTKIKIDNMREQHRNLNNIIEEASSLEEEEMKKYGFVSVARGQGIEAILIDLGVDSVIEGGQTMNPSTQDILDSINKVNAEHIFILPNNKNIIMAANQAVELTEKKVYVIPTKTIPQGITALTMVDLEAEVEANINTMKEAMSNVSTGSITYAVKDTEAENKIINEGDILGLVEEKIIEVGSDIFKVCGEIIESMIDEYSELLTLYYGEEVDEEKVSKFIEELEKKYSDLDVQCYSGKQPLYYFILSVE